MHYKLILATTLLLLGYVPSLKAQQVISKLVIKENEEYRVGPVTSSRRHPDNAP
jgi:hypothetical protein